MHRTTTDRLGELQTVDPPTPIRPNTPRSLRWLASFNATVVHIAASMARGLPLLESRWGESIIEPAREVRSVVRRLPVPDAIVWAELGGLAAEHEDPYELAQQVGTRLDQDQAPMAALGEALAQLKQVVRNGHAELLDELAVRARPLREQWEARGPGMMAELLQACRGLVLADQTNIVLVYPLLGGGGWASVPHDAVLLEAVLVDPVAWLPEPVRLGWLMAQLGTAAVEPQTAIAPGRFPLVAQLALIPPTLNAARQVELVRERDPRLSEILAAWHVPSLPERPVAELLDHWWNGVLHEKLDWPAALERLDQLL